MTITLSRLVAQVESDNQPQATRYEPGFAKYVTQRSIDAIKRAYKPAYMNDTTAKTLLMFSWGRHQIMGENLYVLGLQVPLHVYQADDAQQESMFRAYCDSRNIAFSIFDLIGDENKRKTFARKYNGSELYADRLMNVYRRMVV